MQGRCFICSNVFRIENIFTSKLESQPLRKHDYKRKYFISREKRMYQLLKWNKALNLKTVTKDQLRVNENCSNNTKV